MTAKKDKKIVRKPAGKTVKKAVTRKVSKTKPGTVKDTSQRVIKNPHKTIDIKPKVIRHQAPMPQKRAVKIGVKQKRFFKELLMAMRERLMDQVTMLTRQSLQRDDAVVSEEDGTDAYERQFALTIASVEHDSLFEIDSALRRLNENKYGICESCGCIIEKPRLEALPFVRMCIRCQSESEKGQARARYPESESTQ